MRRTGGPTPARGPPRPRARRPLARRNRELSACPAAPDPAELRATFTPSSRRRPEDDATSTVPSCQQPDDVPPYPPLCSETFIAYSDWPDQNDGPLPLAAFAALDALRHPATAVDDVSEASAKELPRCSRGCYCGRTRSCASTRKRAARRAPTTMQCTGARAAHGQPLAHRRAPRPS